jgi:hypothetical protein
VIRNILDWVPHKKPSHLAIKLISIIQFLMPVVLSQELVMYLISLVVTLTSRLSARTKQPKSTEGDRVTVGRLLPQQQNHVRRQFVSDTIISILLGDLRN